MKNKCQCRDCGLVVVVDSQAFRSFKLIAEGWHEDGGQWICPECWHHRVHRRHMIEPIEYPSLFVKEAKPLLQELEDLFYDNMG